MMIRLLISGSGIHHTRAHSTLGALLGQSGPAPSLAALRFLPQTVRHPEHAYNMGAIIGGGALMHPQCRCAMLGDVGISSVVFALLHSDTNQVTRAFGSTAQP